MPTEPDPQNSESEAAGPVYLIGAGPGDPSLMTRRAHELLHDSDAVLLDALAPREVTGELDDAVEVYDVGKRAGSHSRSQSEINQLMLELSRQGRVVSRLHGGDPMVFGRGGEELRFLRSHGVEVEVVPGITAACSVSAATGIPLTDRDLASEVTLLTGHEAPDKSADRLDWDCLANCRKTLVIYMGRFRLEEIAERLIDRGRDPQTPAVVISRATREDQRVVRGRLSNIARRCDRVELPTPATILIGEVAGKQTSTSSPEEENESGTQRGGSAPRPPPVSVPTTFLLDWAFQNGLY